MSDTKDYQLYNSLKQRAYVNQNSVDQHILYCLNKTLDHFVIEETKSRNVVGETVLRMLQLDEQINLDSSESKLILLKQIFSYFVKLCEKLNNMNTTMIFVYGTLKRGFGNSRFLNGQEFIGVAETSPDYRLFDGGAFPAMIECPAKGLNIKGEIWRIDNSCRRMIDCLEGINHGLYKRIPVTLVSHPNLNVETYVMPKIPDGWKDCGTNWR